MGVDIELPIDEIEEEQEQTSRTYKLDLDSGRIRGITDGIEAVNQAIRKAILTPRFECLIYDDQYGSDIKSLISDGQASRELIETVIPDFVEEALSQDTRIFRVYDFEISFKGNGVCISFKADTIFGETQFKEVV